MTVIELPFPPSVNRIWRFGRGRTKKKGKPRMYLDPKYEAWAKEADALYLANKRKWKPVKGQFVAVMCFKKGGRGDLDNRIKPVLDWLQRAGIIEDDLLCEALSATWGDCGGVRVALTPYLGGEPHGAIWCLGR